MATETTEQIVREAPEIEAYKLGLLKSARQLADKPITLPIQQIAEQSGLQTKAAELAEQGLGAYAPYLQEGGFTMGDAYTALDAAQGQAQPYFQEAAYTMGDAGAALAGAQGRAEPYITGSYGMAGEMFQQAAGAPTAEMIQGYMNPYQEAVQAEINRAFDIQQNQAAGQAVGAGAFGGSRAEIAQREIDRNRAQALAQSQAQNFLQAQQGATNQLQRQMAAAQGIGSLGLQTGQTLGQLGLQTGQSLGQLGSTMAALGGQQAQLGLQTGEALGTLGLRQASLGELGQKMGQQEASFIYDMGKQQQLQQQAELEAKRQSDLAQLYEPYQRFSYLSDIYKGAPSTQQTIAASTSPSVSPAQQFLGTGIAGLSAAAGASKAGLFG